MEPKSYAFRFGDWTPLARQQNMTVDSSHIVANEGLPESPILNMK